MSSATQRCLKLLRKEGWTCQVVEKWQAFARKRIDLFGCIDIIAVKPGAIMGIQSTTTSVEQHVKKVKEECPHLLTWLKAGGLFQIWGWSKKGARGKRKTYQVRRLPFYLTEAGTLRIVELNQEGIAIKVRI